MARFGFVGPSYVSESPTFSDEECINFYVEPDESGDAKSAAALYPTPGLKIFSTLAGASVRGQFYYNGRYFAVAGPNFYEIDNAGTATLRGTVANDELPVSMAAGPTQLMIVSDNLGYSFTFATNTFAAIVGLLADVLQCGYVDGYFVALHNNSDKFQISALLDCTTWDALDIFQVEVYPDNVVGMFIDHREIWFFGSKATQPYYDSGDPDTPWQPVVGGFIENGMAAPWATSKLDNSIFWLGANERGAAIAWRANGYVPQRVSNHAVEWAWSQYPRVDDAISYSYEDIGHAFWVIYFPTPSVTWVYDASTGLWHRRGYWDIPTAKFTAHRSQNFSYAFGKYLVGDWNSAKIYEMSTDYYDDNGDALRRLRRAPVISSEEEWIYHRQLQLDMEVGLGTSTGQGQDPQVVLRWSDDGGKTWSNEHQTSAGKIGEYKTRVIWRRLGRARNRVYEVYMTDPIPWRITSAYLKADPGFVPTERMISQARKSR